MANLDGQLVVAISSRALFDFEEENRVFEEGMAQPQGEGGQRDAAYMRLQLERLDVPAKPGVAFSLVKKLLCCLNRRQQTSDCYSLQRCLIAGVGYRTSCGMYPRADH